MSWILYMHSPCLVIFYHSAKRPLWWVLSSSCLGGVSIVAHWRGLLHLRPRTSLSKFLCTLLWTTLTVRLATNIRRAFSSTARALLEIIWEGTKSHPKYEDLLKEKMKKNRKLSGADKVKFACVTQLQCSNHIIHWHNSSGEPHTSDKDKELRASGQIFQGQSRLTSVHVYENGTVEYSKASFNGAQE